MLRWVLRQVSVPGLLVAAAVMAGCDSDSFAPPPTGGARPSSSASGAMPVRAKEIVMILPAADNTDLTLYDIVGRNESGLLKVVYRSLRPSAGDPPGKQGELVKQAAAEGASAMIVVPDGTKETADAIAAVDTKKTPVVLLGRVPMGMPPSTTTVTFEGFAASAKKLVAAVVEDAPKVGASAEAPAILVTGKADDETKAERDAALADALKAAKIRVVATVPVDTDTTLAEKAVEAALKAHPDARATFCDDDSGITAANAARHEITDRKYLVAGYFAGRNNAQTLMNGYVSALAERSIEALIRRTARTVVDRAEGKAGPAKVQVEIPIRRGSVVANATVVSPINTQPAAKGATEPDKVKAPAEPKKDK